MPHTMLGLFAPLILVALGGYLLGSVPFGLVLTRAAGLGDVRKIGSGSIGATNVLRTGRKDIAALTVLLDAAKGTLAVVLATYWMEPFAGLVAGVFAVLGHCTCPWLGFRGGKGVATGFGVLLGWAWPAALACAALWLGIAVLSRRSSAAGILAAVATPFLLYPVSVEAACAGLVVSAIILVRHHANIRRLLNGTEPKIGARP